MPKKPKEKDAEETKKPVLGAPKGKYKAPEIQEAETVVEEKQIPKATKKPSAEDEVVRVFIEEKSVSAYLMPLVEKPPAKHSESKTIKKEDYPNQGRTKLPDPFPELPEKSRSYLKLWPYGGNIIVNRKLLQKLQNFPVAVKELPLPQTVITELNKHHDLIREILNLISLKDVEEDWSNRLKDSYEPLFPNYVCKCYTRKRRASASPTAKKKKGKTEETDDE